MNLLLSYAYIRKSAALVDIVNKPFANLDLLVDSGAFTAHHSGVPIDLDDYMGFCARLPEGARYIQLDVLGNRTATLDNLREMYRQGLTPMPVLTIDMEVSEWVPRLLEYSDSICIAGGARMSVGAFLWRMHELRRLAPRAQVHGLAFTRGTALNRSRLDSVDSSSWSSGCRFLTIPQARGPNVSVADLRRLSFENWPRSAQLFFIDRGLSPALLRDPHFVAHREGLASFVTVLSIHETLKIGRWARRLGMRYYYACAKPGAGGLAAFAQHSLCLGPDGEVSFLKFKDLCTRGAPGWGEVRKLLEEVP